MWGVIAVVGFAAVVSALEAPRLWERRRKRELVAFVVLLVGNGILMSLNVLRVPMPNPFEWIDWLIGLLG